jgi:photosystem II stability/assembly factor-like uncharacterized protein
VTRSRRALIYPLCLTMSLLASLAQAQSAVAGGPGRGAGYVALGDSYAAGEGLGGFEYGTDVPATGKPNTNPRKNLCHRSSSYAYGSLTQTKPIVLPLLPMSRRSFWACSGARSTDMLTSPGALAVSNPYYQAGQPTQTLTVDDRTRWISVSAGGNDVGFGRIGRACAVYTTGRTASRIPGVSDTCATALGRVTTDLPALRQHLTTLYSRLLDRAPNAVLAVVGYPRVFPATYDRAFTARDGTRICLTNLPYSDPETGAMIGVGVKVADARRIDTGVISALNSSARAVITTLSRNHSYAGRLVFADSYNRPDDVPQSCTGATRNVTVNGVILSLAGHGIDPSDTWARYISSATFHPTRAGQRVLGRAVQAAFEAKLAVTTGELVNGQIGQAYSARLASIAGSPAFAWSLAAGQLPPGLRLSGSGVLSGTPTTAGLWSFAARVTDGAGKSAARTLHVAVFSSEGTGVPVPWPSVAHNGSDGPSMLSCPEEQHCLAVQDGQLVSTSDGGVSWSSLQLSLGAVLAGTSLSGTGYVRGLACTDVMRCLLSVGSFSGQDTPLLVATHDGGRSWAITNPPDGAEFWGAISCAPDGTCHLTAHDAGDGTPLLATTTDLGATWITRAVPPTIPWPQIDCSASHVCVAFGDEADSDISLTDDVAVTVDEGATWTTTRLDTGVYVETATCTSPRTCLVITSQNTASGNVKATLLSSDGGVTWVPGTLPAGTSYLYQLACPGPAECWGLGWGESGPIFHTTDGGASWTEQRGLDHLGGYDISCPTAATCYVSGSVAGGGGTLDMSVVWTHDAGDHWSFTETPVLGDQRAVACATASRCVVADFDGNVTLETVDGGATWSTSSQLDWPPPGWWCFGCLGVHGIRDLTCTPRGPCWARFSFGFALGSGSDPALYRLDGDSWTPIPTPYQVYPDYLACPGRTTCFVVTDHGIYRTTDAGATWVHQAGLADGWHRGALACGDTIHCVLGDNDGSALRTLYTTDGGATWHAVTTGPLGAGTISCPTPSTCWAAGHGGGAWKSTDSGTHWSAEATPIAYPGKISCPDDQDCWFAGEDSAGANVIAVTHTAGRTWDVTGAAGRSVACPALTTCLSPDYSDVYRMPAPW